MRAIGLLLCLRGRLDRSGGMGVHGGLEGGRWRRWGVVQREGAGELVTVGCGIAELEYR